MTGNTNQLLDLSRDLLRIASRAPYGQRVGVLQVTIRTLLLAKKRGASLVEVSDLWLKVKELAAPERAVA